MMQRTLRTGTHFTATHPVWGRVTGTVEHQNSRGLVVGTIKDRTGYVVPNAAFDRAAVSPSAGRSSGT
jgi:hypothetical protein